MKINKININLLMITLLLVCLVFCAIFLLVANDTQLTTTAYAATKELDQTVKNKHDSAFGEGHSVNNLIEINQNYFTTSGNALNAGKYYLSSNVDLVDTIQVNGAVELCLNGFELRGNGTSTVLFVNSGATLILHDCDESGNGEGKITDGCGSGAKILSNSPNFLYVNGGGVYVDTDGTFKMYSGEISGNTTGKYGCGGGVYVHTNGVFEMYGGEISENTGDVVNGSGVYVRGSFVMENGTISRNFDGFQAGGVCVEYGTFVMKNGKITNNSSTWGGGVYVTYGTFEMYDGEISENTVENNAGGIDINLSSSFTMSGGKVCRNTAKYCAGGVFIASDVAFNVSGNSVITDNKLSDGTNDNVCLYTEKSYIAVGELEEGAKIGVSLYRFHTSELVAENGSKYAKHFFSDDSSKCIWGVDDGLYLKDHQVSDNPVSSDGSNICTEGGNARFYCENGCGYYDERSVGALGHNYKYVQGKNPSCTEAGYISHYYCNQCGGYFREEGGETWDFDKSLAIPALEHSFGDWESDGEKHWRKCERCNTISDRSEHQWDDGEIRVQPTETENGEKIHTCKECGHVRTETIPTLNGEIKNPDNTTPSGDIDNGVTGFSDLQKTILIAVFSGLAGLFVLLTIVALVVSKANKKS